MSEKSGIRTDLYLPVQTNQDGETPEEITGVGGVEQKRARQHVVDTCGEP